MKYYIIAGEASGDLHASKLIDALKMKDRDAEFRFWGGDLMEKAAGTKPRRHLDELSFMGFVEVIRHLPKIYANFRFVKKDIDFWDPDVIIYIDFPGFNLRMAKWSHHKGYRNFYYISPQVWAWKEGRVEKMKQYIDELFVVLPFEKDYFIEKGMDNVHYFGHPLKDEIQVEMDPRISDPNDIRIALLPGSRKQEINQLLPDFILLAAKHPSWKFQVAQAPSQKAELYEALFKKYKAPSNIHLYNKGTARLMPTVDAAVVASGTATLETALYSVPQVVTYKSSWISYQIAKRVIKVGYISLVNLILDRKLITELIQDECSITNINKELTQLVRDSNYRDEMIRGYKELSKKLGEPGVSDRVAEKMIGILQDQKEA